MSSQAKRLILSLLIIFMPGAAAYELGTHQNIASRALDLSSVGNSSDDLGNLALDISGTDDGFFVSSSSAPTTIRQIIENGARSEDDNPRPVTHFFNPRTSKGVLEVGPPSPSWALEDDRSYDAPLILKILTFNPTLEIQNYSLVDANEYLYDALTLEEPQERLDQAALFFETLGRVIHHIQDMAQPQHTRDDVHLTDGYDSISWPGEDPSLHEKWTELNRNRLPYKLSPTVSYPVPAFPTARALWETTDGRGMANFSNAGFVSADTNFGEPGDPPNPDYPTPHVDTAEGWWVPDVRPLFAGNGIDAPSPCLDPQTPCEMWFLRTLVQDKLNPGLSADNDFTSTSSMFDDELEKRGLKKTYSLNRFNFDRANKFLIPRAVSYSAGLIDFVFRGKLTAEAAEQRNGTVKLALANESADGNEFSDGQFELWYDDASGMRHSVAGLRISGAPDATLVSPFDSSESVELEAAMPPDATPDTRFVLTYRGTIGQETGIASVSFQVEPYRTGFAVTLPGGSAGYVSWKNGQWKFIPDADIQAGNIDWRGAYVNGKPTKTLTWSGPTSRYFDGGRKYFTFNDVTSVWRSSTFHPNVYENGRLLAVAPRPVLGAAITQDSLGKEWIVVVTSLGPLKRIVYRRPYERSDSSALYDPITNPDGWKEIGHYSAPPDERWGEPRSPWFFNGDGTAAQTMETIALAEGELPPARMVRIELRISDTGVTWINHGNLNEEANWVNVSSQCVSDYTAKENGNLFGSGSETVTHSGRTVIAVDYLDDREILAIMQVEGTTHREDTTDQDKGIQDWRYQQSYKESLLLGTRFELSGVESLSEYSRPDDENDRLESHYFGQTNQIRFMDLRDGILQFAEYSTTTGGIAGRGIIPTFTTIKTNREILATTNSTIVSMHEETTEFKPTFSSIGGSVVTCPSEPQWQRAPHTLYWPHVELLTTCPLCLSEFSLHNGYQVGLKGSVAIDESGRIFSSQDIVGLPPSPNVTSNYLSGAPGESPATVIGIGEDDRTLYEPRVIR